MLLEKFQHEIFMLIFKLLILILGNFIIHIYNFSWFLAYCAYCSNHCFLSPLLEIVIIDHIMIFSINWIMNVAVYLISVKNPHALIGYLINVSLPQGSKR